MFEPSQMMTSLAVTRDLVEGPRRFHRFHRKLRAQRPKQPCQRIEAQLRPGENNGTA